MKISIESSKKKSEYNINIYGALDVRLFPNKRLNVDLKNIEIWVSHGLNKNKVLRLNYYSLAVCRTARFYFVCLDNLYTSSLFKPVRKRKCILETTRNKN